MTLLAERPAAAAPALPAPAPGPLALARLTAGSAYLLLIAGGLVTSTGSSLAVPDWPLSFGKAFPPMVGGVLFEHGHRMIAGVVAALTLVQAAWALRRGSRGLGRWLALAAAGSILVQALLGGLTVLLRLPPPVSIAHACLGQAVFCVLLAYAETLSPSWRVPAWPAAGLWALGAAFGQLVLGAVLRHTGEGLVLHACWAAVVLLLAARLPWLTFRAAPRTEERLPAGLLAVLLPAQVLLGYAAYRVRFSPDFETGLHAGSLLVTAHVAAGAAILGSCLLWTLRRRP